MILSNQAKCGHCGDAPFSASRHDYQECSCGNVMVDGGMSYIRHGWRNVHNYHDISIEWDDQLVEAIGLELDKMKQAGRNSLGLTCAVARVLRDNGYEIKKVDECSLET